MILGAIVIAGLCGFAALLATAPAPVWVAPRWLRVVGGGLCFSAVVLAWTAAGALRGADRRWPFISEVLAAYHEHERTAPSSWANGVGSLVTNVVMFLGACLFLLDSVWLDGAERLAVIATAVALVGVVIMPLRATDPRNAPASAFAHPHAAALFYFCAIVLSLVERDRLGRFGQLLAAMHVASSATLIVLSLTASMLEYSWRQALGPPSFGTRILLDTSADSRARWVRRWQWSTTFVVGAALAVGAAGL